MVPEASNGILILDSRASPPIRFSRHWIAIASDGPRLSFLAVPFPHHINPPAPSPPLPLGFIARCSFDPIRYDPSIKSLRRMTSFDSTFEALALHYVGFGLFAVVNNIWTVLALATAAVSFWRLRGVSLPVQFPSDRRLAPSPERESTSSAIDSRPWSFICDAPEGTTTSAVSADTVIPRSPKIATAPPTCDEDGVTKGKFVTYYREDDCRDTATAADEVEEEVEHSGDRRCSSGAGEWWEGWEKALRIRSNGVEKGTGWYEYQDLAVLSGSVVRLWEEERRESVITSSVTSASRRCVVCQA